MDNQHFEYERIKSKTNKLLRDLKDIKEFFGTLTDCEFLHCLEFSRFNWLYCPKIMDMGYISNFFVWCVEQNIFTLVSTDDGRKYSNFGSFNRSRYREVEAFLQTINNYWAIQNLEVEQQWAVEQPVYIAFSVLQGTKTLAQYEAETLSKKVDFFPKTNEGRIALSIHRGEMAALDIARTIIDAMPDFDYQQLHANAKEITPDNDHFDYLLYDFVAIAESILGFERPKNRLSEEQSDNQLRLMRMLKTQDSEPAAQKTTEAVKSKPKKRFFENTSDWKQIIPAPTPEKISHFLHGMPSMQWEYKNERGELIGLICRFDTPDGKQVLPYTYCTDGKTEKWKWQGFEKPRPLYGLDRLANNPTAKVFIVEGEKAADAAQKLFVNSVCITWPGGANGVQAADFSPLKGRDCILWPDNDAPGMAAMLYVYSLLLEDGVNSVKWVPCPADAPAKWDIADASEWTQETAVKYVIDNIQNVPAKATTIHT